MANQQQSDYSAGWHMQPGHGRASCLSLPATIASHSAPSPGAHSGRSWRLSNAGGIELIAALLAIDSAANDMASAPLADAARTPAAEQQLAELLLWEPGLACWTAARAARSDGISIRTRQTAAAWLAKAGLLEWEDWEKSAAAFSDLTPANFAEWTDVAAHSSAMADSARDLATADASPSADEAEWLALTGAASWGTAISDTAISDIATAGVDDERIAACRQRWLQPAVDAGWVPAVVSRMARLARLEGDFRNQLEREKLAALKELAYGAGHEINNPLANISSRADAVAR